MAANAPRGPLGRLIDPASKVAVASFVMSLYVGVSAFMATLFNTSWTYLNGLSWFHADLFTLHGFTVDPSVTTKAVYFCFHSTLQIASLLHVFHILF